MSALTVLIIRHAEKPLETVPGPGFDEAGVEDGKSLVIRGWQRAGAWAALFGSGLGGADYPRPSVIYAASADKADADGKQPSRRPLETILPLAARLRLTPITRWGKDEVQPLADEIDSLTGAALIAWEHKKILPDLLDAVLARQSPTTHLPGKWPDDRYDVVLRLDRPEPTAPWSFRQLFPCLLAGDADRPL